MKRLGGLRPLSATGRHLLTFLHEHPWRANRGYLICRCAAPRQLHEQITALPWFCL